LCPHHGADCQKGFETLIIFRCRISEFKVVSKHILDILEFDTANIIIIEFFNTQLWLGNIHLSWDVVINRIRLGGLTYSLKSFLQLNMCQELQIFAVLYIYSGAG